MTVPIGSLSERLADGEVVRLDGGFATTAAVAGADVSSPLWSAALLTDDPDTVVATHRAFLGAGADAVLTASYQLARESLRRAGRDPDDEQVLLHRSVALAHLAVADHARRAGTEHAPNAMRRDGRRALVVGSLGPWGAVVGGGREYVGRYRLGVEELVAFHRPRVAALVAAGVDAVAFETVPAAGELTAIAEVTAGSGVPVWVTATTDPSGTATPEGTPLLEAFAPLLGLREIVAVGVNCVPPERVLPALRALAASGRPLVAKPNVGDRYVEGRGWVPPGRGPSEVDDHDRTAGRARDPAVDPVDWVAAGARLVGGCCGTDPAALQRLLAALDGDRRR